MTLVASPEGEVHVVGSAATRYQRQLFATMVVEGKEVKFQLDTGAIRAMCFARKMFRQVSKSDRQHRG